MSARAILQVFSPGGVTNESGTSNFLQDLSFDIYQAQWTDLQVGGLADATFQLLSNYEDVTDLLFPNWVVYGQLGGDLETAASANDTSITVRHLRNQQFAVSPNLYQNSDTLASSTATNGTVSDGVFTSSSTSGSVADTVDVTPGTPYTFSGEVAAPSGGISILQSAKSSIHALTANFTLSSNPVVGNLLVVEMIFSYGTFTPPSGWTVVDNVPQVGSAWGVVTLYRVMQAGDTKTSWASSFGAFSVTSYAVVAAYELSGVDTTSPINGHSYFSHVAPTTVVIPAVTPTVIDCLALSLASIYTATPSAPSGFTSDQSGNWGGGNFNSAHESRLTLSPVAPSWGSDSSLAGSAALVVLSPAQSRVSVKDTSGTLLASQTSGAGGTSLTWTPLSGVTEAVFSYEQNGASGTGTFQKPMLRVDGVSDPYTKWAPDYLDILEGEPFVISDGVNTEIFQAGAITPTADNDGGIDDTWSIALAAAPGYTQTKLANSYDPFNAAGPSGARVARLAYQGYIDSRQHITDRSYQTALVCQGHFNRYGFVIGDSAVGGTVTSTTLTAASAVGDTTINVASTVDIIAGTGLVLDGGEAGEPATVDSVLGLVVTLTAALTKIHANGATVSVGSSGDGAKTILDMCQSYADTLKGIIVDSDNFATTSTPVVVSAQDTPLASLFSTILQQEDAISISQIYTMWVDACREVHHASMPTDGDATFTIDLDDDPNSTGDAILSLQTTDQDGSALMNAAVVTGGQDPATSDAVRITVEQSDSITSYGYFEGTLSNDNITNADQLAAWAGTALAIAAFPATSAALQLSVASGRMTARDLVEITGFTDSSTFKANPIQIQYTATGETGNVTAQVTLGVLCATGGTALAQIAAQHAIYQSQTKPGVALTPSKLINGCAFTQGSGTSFTVSAGTVEYQGVRYDIPAYSGTAPDGVSVWGAEVLPSLTVAELPHVTWNGKKHHASASYTVASPYAQPAQTTIFQGVKLFRVHVLNSQIVGVTTIANAGGIDGHNLSSGTGVAPTLSGSALWTEPGSGTTGISTTMQIAFTLEDQPQDGSVTGVVAFVGVDGQRLAAQPTMPLQTGDSANYTVTLPAFTNGTTYAATAAYVAPDGTHSSTVSLGTHAAPTYRLGDFTAMPATGSPSIATEPTVSAAGMGAPSDTGAASARVSLTATLGDWTSAPSWYAGGKIYHREHGTTDASECATFGSQSGTSISLNAEYPAGESADFGLSVVDQAGNETPITWPSQWSQSTRRYIQSGSLSVMPATGSPSIATAPTLSSVSAGTPYTLGAANAYVELEWTLADWTAGNAPGWVGMGHLVRRPHGETQVSLAGTFVIGETVAFTQYVAYPAGEATDFGLQLSDIGAANQTPIVWPSSWQNIAAQTMNAANAKYSTGSTVEALRPEEAGAQVFDGKPLDTLVDSAGYKLMRYGMLASRPAAATAGRLYHAEDAGTNGITYRDTGTAWVEIGVGHLADIGGDTDNVTEGTNKFAAEHGADVTSGHTAAAITGQGALATKNNVGNGDLSGVTLDGVGDSGTRYAVGDVDANHRALIDFDSSHVNQGALSKKNNVDLSTTDVTNKILDNIADGTTYARVKGTALASGEVDLSASGVINKTLDHVTDGSSRVALANNAATYGVANQLSDAAGENTRTGDAIVAVIGAAGDVDVSKARSGTIMPLVNHAAEVTGAINEDGSVNVASKNLLPNADMSVSGSAAVSPNTGTLPKFWAAYNNASVDFAFAHDATAAPPVGSGAWQVANNSGSTTTNTMGLYCGTSNIDGSQNQLLYAGKTYVVSFYARSDEANLVFSAVGNAGVTVSGLAGFPDQYNDTAWHRYAELWTVGSGNYVGGIFLNAYTVGNGNSLWFAGVQLEEGSVPSAWSGPSVPPNLTSVFDLLGSLQGSTTFNKTIPNSLINLIANIVPQTYSDASGNLEVWFTSVGSNSSSNPAGSQYPAWTYPDGSGAIYPGYINGAASVCGTSYTSYWKKWTGLIGGQYLVVAYDPPTDAFVVKYGPSTSPPTDGQIQEAVGDGEIVASLVVASTGSTIPVGGGGGHSLPPGGGGAHIIPR